MGFHTRRRLGLLLILLAAAFVLFFVLRYRIRAYGPAIALCPGPDQYGYRCQSGAGYAYLDATEDTGLYADDGIVRLPLPFPFTFYGTTYSEVQISSNGNLQFGNAHPGYSNVCLSEGVAPGMGDLIAPYWDDLDLRAYGFLETATFGSTPNRIFVIEWDEVPRFGADSDDLLTFEVQLFETSHDIVFLYEDTSTLTGDRGSGATIGLQSAAQGVALQYSCDQPVVADASGIHFPHPIEPNEALGQEQVLLQEYSLSAELALKGDVATLVSAFNERGPIALGQLRQAWRNQTPAKASDWRWVDLDGSGREELVLLWRGAADQPHLTQLVVLAIDDQGQMGLLFDQLLSSRHSSLTHPAFLEVADLTHDGQVDILMGDQQSGQMFLLAWSGENLARYPVPERCLGSTALLDKDGDGRLELWRSNCASGARTNYSWEDGDFVPGR